MAKNLCFVLGAGGARGIAHIGFLQAMEEYGIKPNFIVGCSMGSVVGSCYANGQTPKHMKAIAEKFKSMDIIDLSVASITKKGILKSEKLKKIITTLLGDTKFEDLKIPFACVAVDIVTGNTVTFKTGKVEEGVRASSSIPVVFRPVEIDNMVLVDGGLSERVPVRVAKEEFNPDVIVAVDVIGKLKEYTPTKNIFGQALRVVDVSDTILSEYYLEKYKPDLLLEPDLGSMSQYKVASLMFAYEQGYKMGIENAEKIKELIEN